MAERTPPRRSRRSDDPRWFTGDIIVCLRDDEEPRPGLARATDALADLTGFLRDRGVPEPVPLIGSVPPEAIDELERYALEREAEESRLQPRRSLNSYWKIDGRSQGAPEFVDALSRLPGVQTAYRERRVRDPSPPPGGNPFNTRQTYLDGGGRGIDARSMWPLTRGKGVSVADVERAWNLDHEELVGNPPSLAFGTNLRDILRDQGDHGTAVLGVLAAADNPVGIVGVAPEVDEVIIASRFECVSRSDTQVVPAIAAATLALLPGDVLLVEVECDPGLPVEIQQAEFDAIRLAVDSGRVVVEAAGNGKEDLSRLPKVLCTFTVDFRAVWRTCARESNHGASASVDRARAQRAEERGAARSRPGVGAHARGSAFGAGVRGRADRRNPGVRRSHDSALARAL